MGILRSIVQAFVLAMFHTREYFLFCCCIAAELIGDQHTRDVLTALQQLAKELLGGLFVPPALNQDIEHSPVLINCPPQIVRFAVNCKKHLIEVPFVAGLRTSSTQLVGRVLTELSTALADCFVGQHDATRGHELFHITITERESKVQPHSMADNLDRKAMALKGAGRQCVHAPMIPQLQVAEPAVWLT